MEDVFRKDDGKATNYAQVDVFRELGNSVIKEIPTAPSGISSVSTLWSIYINVTLPRRCLGLGRSLGLRLRNTNLQAYSHRPLFRLRLTLP